MIIDNKIIQAYQDNRIDLHAAQENGDIADIQFCKGCNCALEYILDLLGFDIEEVKRRPIQKGN